MRARSLLFAPANRPDLFGKFPRYDADILVLDLEDGTPPDARPAARAALAESLRTARGPGTAMLCVRVNPAGSPDFADDVAAVKASGADGIVLAKADAADDVARLDTALPVIAGIESIAGVRNVDRIAAASGVVAVFFGAEDFAAEMGARRTRVGLEVLYARSRVVLAARAAGVKAIDQVVLDFRDDALFREDAASARNLGYDGKMCIHPRQIALANEAFTPTDAEVAYAARLVQAYDAAVAAGQATIGFEGRMVDGPLYKSSLAVLAAAGRGR